MSLSFFFQVLGKYLKRVSVNLTFSKKWSILTAVCVLRKDGFGEDRYFQCLVAEATPAEGSGERRTLVGYCLYYYIYSPWVRKCCYMEDLYVHPEWRSKSIGTAILVEVTKIALSKGCSRMHWTARDWNSRAIEMYYRRGGINLTEKEGWHLFRMTKPVMENFVVQNEPKFSS